LEQRAGEDNSVRAGAAAYGELQLADTESDQHAELYRDRNHATLFWYSGIRIGRNGLRAHVRRHGRHPAVPVVFRARDDGRPDAIDVFNGSCQSLVVGF